LNFQNEQAVINAGAFLEVLVALAVMNAAALSPGITCTFLEFFSRFLKELGIEKADVMLSAMAEDKAFESIRVTRYVFPGTEADSSQVVDPIGIFERSRNMKRKNGVLYNLKGTNGFGLTVDRIQFEAKDRQEAETTKQIAAVAKKLVAQDGHIGIMRVKGCPQFATGADGSEQKALAHFKGKMQDSQVGSMYLVKCDGSIHPSGVKDSAHGRFIIVQIPEL
jgi:hypothetical protein